MNDWNNSEQYNSYDGCNSSSVNYNNDNGSKRFTNRNGNNRNNTKARGEQKKDTQLLSKIVQQNETIIGLLKGIKQALNNGSKPNQKGIKNTRDYQKSVPQTGPRKQFVQRFDDDSTKAEKAAYKKRNKRKEKSLSDNINVEIIEEALVDVAENLNLDLEMANENEVGEENPFTMFDVKNNRE